VEFTEARQERGTGGEHGLGQPCQPGFTGDHLAHPGGALAGSDLAELQPESLQCAAPLVLEVLALRLQNLAMAQQDAALLARRRFDVHRAIPAGAHGRGDRLGVLAIALHRHDTRHRAQPPRLDADRRPAALFEAAMKPRRPRTGFEANPASYSMAALPWLDL
jgi:hypothetical protein